MPEAAPADYLQWIQWWRDAARYTTSAATLGAVHAPAPGRTPVLDLVDFELPGQVEEQALKAQAAGEATVAPQVTVDADLATEARTVVRQRREWLRKMAKNGAPVPDPSLEPLLAEAVAAADRDLIANGIEVSQR